MEGAIWYLKFTTVRLLSPSSWFLSLFPVSVSSSWHSPHRPAVLLTDPWAPCGSCVCSWSYHHLWIVLLYTFISILIILKITSTSAFLSAASLLWPRQPRHLWTFLECLLLKSVSGVSDDFLNWTINFLMREKKKTISLDFGIFFTKIYCFFSLKGFPIHHTALVLSISKSCE